MAESGRGGLPVGKLVSLAVIVALVALPVVSCGPIECMGHELLRNRAPDVDGLSDGLDKSFGELGRRTRELNEDLSRMGEEAGRPRPPGEVGRDTKAAESEREHLFEGGEVWMHWLYVAVLAAAVASLFFGTGSRARALLGLGGLAGLLVFLGRFDTAVARDEEAAEALSMFEWDAGAYIAVIGFAVLLVEGYLLRAAARGAAGPAAPAEAGPGGD